MTKDEAMLAYLKPIIKDLTSEPLTFNFSSSEPEGVALLTNYSDREIKTYIHGGAQKAYGFTVLWTKAYSTNSDDLNLEAMTFSNCFMQTLEDKNRKGEWPQFPDGCTVQQVELLQDQPALDGINEQYGLARYRVNGRVLYFESEDK